MITRDFASGVFERRPDLGLSLTLVFSHDANVRQAMLTLLSLHDEGTLSIEDRDMLVVRAMATSGSYDRPENHNIQVRISPFEPDETSFMRLADHLEMLKMTRDHDLQSLQSSRKKRRDEASAQIEATWISNETRETITEWDLELHVSIETDGHFRMCKVSVLHDDREIVTVLLDGWSGLMRYGEKWFTDRTATPERLNWILRQGIHSYLESITA